MRTEFHRIITSDGIELQGLYFTPSSGDSDTTVIHVHGLAGNFYENRFIDNVADAVVAQEMGYMSFNNRGHEYISDSIFQPEGMAHPDYKQIGGAYEKFEDCIPDIQSYIDFARNRGSKRIILKGHSHGALKATWYLANVDAPDIAGLILLSPSDDFGISRERLGERFDEGMKIAKEFVAKNEARTMMPHGYHTYPMSAATYFDTFRHDSPLKVYNISRSDTDNFRILSKITVPVLCIVGTVDESFVGDPREFLDGIEAAMVNAGSFSRHIISGAPHNYLEHEAEAAKVIGGWLKNLH